MDLRLFLTIGQKEDQAAIGFSLVRSQRIITTGAANDAPQQTAVPMWIRDAFRPE
jgi:hypothetical protein